MVEGVSRSRDCSSAAQRDFVDALIYDDGLENESMTVRIFKLGQSSFFTVSLQIGINSEFVEIECSTKASKHCSFNPPGIHANP